MSSSAESQASPGSASIESSASKITNQRQLSGSTSPVSPEDIDTSATNISIGDTNNVTEDFVHIDAGYDTIEEGTDITVSTGEDKIEDFGGEFEDSKCCQCIAIVPITDWYNGEMICQECSHVRCEDCTEYDSDDHSILSGDENYEVPQYRIEDDEADVCKRLTDVHHFPIKAIVEDGINDLDFVKVAFPKSIQSRVVALAPELKGIIAFDAIKPGARAIRLSWSHSRKLWSYRRYTANKMPFVLVAFGGVLRGRAMNELFSPAPRVGADTYPWFNYELDGLQFDYKRCGSRDRDAQEYVDAMKAAAQHLRDHIAAGGRPVTRVELSWCQNQDSPSEILGFFRRVRGIELIILCAHDHYTGAYEDDMTNHANRWEYDPSDMQKMVNRGELDGYRFEVMLLSGAWNDYEEYVAGAKPLPGRGDDPDSDEDSDKDEDEDEDKDEDEDGDKDEDEDEDKDSDEDSDEDSDSEYYESLETTGPVEDEDEDEEEE